jgi:hypothetical protein
MAKRHLRTVIAGVAAFITIGLVSFFGASPAYAAEHDYSLWVSPASQDLGLLQPGETYTGEITVQNAGTKDFTYEVYASPYTVSDEFYTADFQTSNHYSSISKWFDFSKESGHLEPGESEKVTYKVKIPKDTPGGAQNASIMVETKDSADTSESSVGNILRVGSVIYSNVNGHTNSCGEIKEGDIPSFLFNPPISASAIVENCGNIDLNVRYIMKVTPLFSNDPIYNTEDNPAIYTTLPETKRYNKMEWGNTPPIGFYNVELEVTYNNKTKVFKKLVIICPFWVIVLIIIFIGAVVFWLVSRQHERKQTKTNAKTNEE